MKGSSNAASPAIDLVNWGVTVDRMTQASVGTDPWTVIQNKLHPAVAETEFTPLDWSHLTRKESIA
jgi:hypothetical protein